MARRYLKRIPSSRKDSELKDLSKQIPDNDPELELLHTLEQQERILGFDKKPNVPKGEKAIKEETRWALDAAGNAGQYLKYFNMRLEKQNLQIKKMKKLKEQYDLEIKNLQSQIVNQQEQIEKVNKELHSATKTNTKKKHSKKN